MKLSELTTYWRWKFPEVIQHEIDRLDFWDWWKKEESETAREMAGFYKQYKDFLALVLADEDIPASFLKVFEKEIDCYPTHEVTIQDSYKQASWDIKALEAIDKIGSDESSDWFKWIRKNS